MPKTKLVENTTEPYKPTFPFVGDQIILSSQRIHLHASEESALIYARKSVGLSSLGTLNLDCNQKAVVASPKIYLGLRAEAGQEPLILGKTFTEALGRFLSEVLFASQVLSSVGQSDPGSSFQKIQSAGTVINKACAKLQESLPGVLSIVSYTE